MPRDRHQVTAAIDLTGKQTMATLLANLGESFSIENFAEVAILHATAGRGIVNSARPFGLPLRGPREKAVLSAYQI